MTDYVYRVVREDGQGPWEGRGSDPFTRVGSARGRASKLTKEAKRGAREGETPMTYKVQRTEVRWEDM